MNHGVDRGRLDLNRVATFVAIVEAGGVTAAASKLKMPKSTVSRNLTQLEQELGVQLLVRGTREFRLSDAGRAFSEAASRGLAAVDEAREALGEENETPRGLVRIAVPPEKGSYLLAPIITRFVKRYPEVQVEVTLSSPQTDPIRDGLDFVIMAGELSDSSMITRRMGTVDAGVFATPEYLAEHGTPRKPRDLAKHVCVLYRARGKKGRWTLTGPKGVTETVVVDGPVRVDDLFTAASIVASDGGLAVLPVHLGTIEPIASGLVRVLPDWIARGEPVQLVYPASRHMPKRVRLLLDAIFAEGSAKCTEAAHGRLPPPRAKRT